MEELFSFIEVKELRQSRFHSMAISAPSNGPVIDFQQASFSWRDEVPADATGLWYFCCFGDALSLGSWSITAHL